MIPIKAKIRAILKSDRRAEAKAELLRELVTQDTTTPVGTFGVTPIKVAVCGAMLGLLKEAIKDQKAGRPLP